MNLIENDITANGIRLHIYRTGTSKPPLVFVHGRSDNGLCFSPIAEQFSDEYEVVLYDSRNHGKSEAPQRSNLVDRADDLAGLIDVLALNKPKLIGHSLGAVTIALFAGLHPSVPDCVVLEDPPPFEIMAAKDAHSMAFNKTWRENAAVNKYKSVEELIEMNRQENPFWSEAERYPWALSKIQFNLNAFDEETIDVASGNRILYGITCPMLLITGSPEKNSLYPSEAADKFAAEMPNVTHINISGAGHNIRRDQPSAYLKVLRDFLAGHEN